MNASVSAVLRGRQAVSDIRVLLSELDQADDDLIVCANQVATGASPVDLVANIKMTWDDVTEVIQRRRSAIILKLENKGLRIAPEPEATP